MNGTDTNPVAEIPRPNPRIMKNRRAITELLEIISFRQDPPAVVSEAYTELYNLMFQPLCNYDVILLADRAWAEDAVQMKFRRLWETPFTFRCGAADSLTAEKKAYAWLKKLDWRIANRLRKSMQKNQATAFDDPEFEEQLDDYLGERAEEDFLDFVAQVGAFWEAYKQRIPRHYRLVIQLRAEDKDYKAIAEALGQSYGQIRGVINRARQLLRTLWREYQKECGHETA